MDMFFYRLSGAKKDIWYTNFNGAVLSEWCAERSIKYKTDYYDGFRIGIILADEKDKVFFELVWGGTTPGKIEDYII